MPQKSSSINDSDKIEKFHRNDRWTRIAATRKEPLKQPISHRIRQQPEQNNHARPPWPRKPPAFNTHKKDEDATKEKSGKGRNQGDTQDGVQSHKSTGGSPRRTSDGVSCTPPPGPNHDCGRILQDSGGVRQWGRAVN